MAKTLDELNVLRNNFVIDMMNKNAKVAEAHEIIKTLQPELDELDMAISEVDRQIGELEAS